MFKGKRYVYLDETPGAAGGAAGSQAAGGAGAAGDAGAAGAGAAGAGDSTGAAAAGADGAGKDGQGSGGAAAGGSALAAGADGDGGGAGAGADGAASGVDAIPEKFVVKNEKGEIDPVASAAKVAEAYTKLEKRLGQGLAAKPKTAAEYKLPELPEALQGVELDSARTDAFREKAHKAGLSQAQFEFVMGEYFEMAPELVAGAAAVSADATIAELKTAWGKDYPAQAANAWRGMTQIAEVAGVTVQQVEAELGNSAAFNRIMAAVGAQLREDTSITTGGQGAGASGMADAATLQASEAFRNEKHPEHKATVAKWNSIVTKGVADTPLM